MTAPGPTVCATCKGETFIVVGDGQQAPCPGCCCTICGKPTSTPPECLDCFCREDSAAVRRADR